ncbi:MAG: hypothetical protein ACTIJ9_05245 [Aequorivita sp.]
MNIQAEKIELIRLLAETNSPKIIESIKKIFKKEQALDFWDELSLEQQEEILQGSSEIEQGKATDYETFIAKHR